MVRNYILIALCVVISEAKLFIGDCSYGFCEQQCKQIRVDEMECFCNRGFALKTDGRKCIKSFDTDDELSSGDDGSGEVGNCDNEDGNCDKTQIGNNIVYSGDDDIDVKSSEEGSGALFSMNEQFGLIKSSIIVIPTNVSAILTSRVNSVYSIVKSEDGIGKTIEKSSKRLISSSTKTVYSITKREDGIGKTIEKSSKRLITSPAKHSSMPTQIYEKHTVTKASSIKGIRTIVKIHPIVGETASLSTERLHTKTYELIPMQTQIYKKETITTSSSLKTIFSIAKKQDIIGEFITPIAKSTQRIPTSSTTYSIVKSTQRIPTSLKIYPPNVVMHTELVEGTPIRIRSVSLKSVPTSIFKSLSTSASKYVPSLRIATSRVKASDILAENRKMLKSVEKISSVYKHISTQSMVSSKSHIKQSHKVIAVPIPTAVVYTKKISEINRFVIQDEGGVIEVMPVYPAKESTSKYSKTHVTGVATFPDATIRKPVMESIKIHEKTGRRATSIVVQTEKVKSVGKTVRLNIDVRESNSESLKSHISTFYVVDTSIAHISNVPEEKVHKIRKTLKGSISSELTKSSFHRVPTSPVIAEKTTPLEVVGTHIVTTSRFLELPLKQTPSFTKKIVGKTVIDFVEKDLASTTSTTSYASSDVLMISDNVKLTEARSYERTPSKIIVPSSAGLKKTEQSDKKVIIQSSPSKRVTETEPVKVIVITMEKGNQSHECRLLVNCYLLTFITSFTIYLLSVH